MHQIRLVCLATKHFRFCKLPTRKHRSVCRHHYKCLRISRIKCFSIFRSINFYSFGFGFVSCGSIGFPSGVGKCKLPRKQAATCSIASFAVHQNLMQAKACKADGCNFVPENTEDPLDKSKLIPSWSPLLVKGVVVTTWLLETAPVWKTPSAAPIRSL